MSKVTTSYPSSNTCWGVWVGDNQNDVHIDFESRSLVLGANKDIPKMKFAPQALCFAEDGKISFQYADAQGNPQHGDVKPETITKLFGALLDDLEKRVKAGQA